jgi:hypothetical protein
LRLLLNSEFGLTPTYRLQESAIQNPNRPDGQTYGILPNMEMRRAPLIDSFIKLVFYLCAGLALVGALVWYVGSAYEALTGRGAVVIAPLTVAGPHNSETDSRGAAMARMLQSRLQQIEHDIVVSQELLLRGQDVSARAAAVASPPPSQSGRLTAIAPTLIATQGVALQTRLLEPTKIKVDVGGVDVGA